MCPDRQILSVYFDGELDSPWKEKCEKHLEGCPSCRARLESYTLARQKLSALVREQTSMEESRERIWNKQSLFWNEAARLKAFPGNTLRRKTFWNGSISVPLPVAAAAVFVMVCAVTVFITLRRPVAVSGDPQLAGLEVQDMAAVPDMASLFQYLGGDNSPDMVIIRLPDTATFRNAGEPRMLRAADYSGNSTSRPADSGNGASR